METFINGRYRGVALTGGPPDAAHLARKQAAAAHAVAQAVPSRGSGQWPGWDTIVTYNFDSLMSEALAEARVPHAACVVRQGGVGADPDRLAQASDWHVPVLHLHGYTPRRLFSITDTRFVFSTSQYAQRYADEAMNGLLARAFERWPGRYHYAFVQWPRARQGVEPSPDEVQAESERYLHFGLRPVWFDDFADLPDMVQVLA